MTAAPTIATTPAGPRPEDVASLTFAAALPCVIYAAKSTEDLRGSIPAQVRDCRAAIGEVSDGQGRRIVSEHVDEGKSAYHGNRGAGLAQAKLAAVSAAAEKGAAEIWVQHSDRLARGDGLTADHLAEIFFAMRRAGVRLRSVQDDSNLEDVIRVALIGERNSEDSRRKSEAVISGKRRQLQRGERMGGPVPDGYLRVVRGDGARVWSDYELDPERAPIIARAFALAAENMGDPSVARTLNREGYRTKSGKPWRRRRVQDLLTNPHYAGRVARFRGTQLEEIADGRHPALVTTELFDRLQAQRRGRDRAAGSARAPGRPSSRFVLSRLARCARCREQMFAITSTYRRKDGTKARHYVCPARQDSTGGCDQPKIDAEALDAVLVTRLPGLFLDFERWREGLVSSHTPQAKALGHQHDQIRGELEKIERRAIKLRERWVSAIDDGDDAIERIALDAMTALERQAQQAASRLADLEAELADHAATDPLDDALDVFADLARAAAGEANCGTVVEVNAGLRELFACFWLDTLPSGVTILPELHQHVQAVFMLDPAAGHGRILNLQVDRSDPLDAIGEGIGPSFSTVVAHRHSRRGRAPLIGRG